MSILNMESFDYVGTSIPDIVLRGYTSLSVNNSIGTGANARTGTGFYQVAANANFGSLLRVLDTAVTTCGQGVGINWTVQPVTERAALGLRFGVGAANDTVEIVGNASFGINVYNGGVLVGSSANNSFVVGTYYWLEAKVITGTGTASIEVRLNGATILLITGLTIGSIARCLIGKSNGIHTGRFDDWVIWDNAGTINNDFLGDRRVVTVYMNADTIEADWTPSAGSGFSCIDEATPSDADFVTANVAGDISEYQKQTIPVDINVVAAVCPVARAFKDSAGPSTFTVGMNSAGNVINSPQFLPNTTVAYFGSIFELNPNGNIPWTRAAVDAAFARLTRVV